MAALVFDLETVPDYPAIARSLGLPPDDIAAIKAAMGDKFPKHGFHRIVAVGYLIVKPGKGRWDLVEWGADHAGTMSEKEMIARLMRRIDTSAVLVSFNGSSFDLPVLRYRAMRHGVSGHPMVRAKYFYRYDRPHIDLCDILSSFQHGAKMKLGEVCAMMNLPGKTEGVDGGKVADFVEDGRIGEVADYCKQDVAATYRLYLAYNRFASGLSDNCYFASMDHLQDIAIGLDILPPVIDFIADEIGAEAAAKPTD